jgi:hypothetical protein
MVWQLLGAAEGKKWSVPVRLLEVTQTTSKFVSFFLTLQKCAGSYHTVCKRSLKGTNDIKLQENLKFASPCIIIQDDSVARGPKIFIDNSLGPLARESPCTIQTNQPTRCSNFSSLLLDVYVQLNVFRASSRPPSGAQQLQ